MKAWATPARVKTVATAALRRVLPPRLAYALSRWKNVLLGMVFYQLCKRRPDKARALGEAGRALVCDRYNIVQVAARYEEVYDEVLARHRSRSTGILGRIG